MVWANSGHGYVVNLTTFVATQIITGLTSGHTQATQYSNQGLLIIDPTGYWDWNITVPNTLTPQNNAISGGTITSATSVAGGTVLTNSGLTGTGEVCPGAVRGHFRHGQRCGIRVCGGRLSHPDGRIRGRFELREHHRVLSVGGGGTITGITLASGGSYSGPIHGIVSDYRTDRYDGEWGHEEPAPLSL